MALTIDTRQFEKAARQLSDLSRRSEPEQIRLNARDALRSIAFNSPRRTGAMNAGWWASWRALGANGTPNTRWPRARS